MTAEPATSISANSKDFVGSRPAQNVPLKLKPGWARTTCLVAKRHDDELTARAASRGS